MVWRSEESKERIRQQQRERRKDPKVKAVNSARGAKWRAENPGYQSEWQKSRNRERYLTLVRKHSGCINPTGEERSGPCEICGKQTEKLRFDHDHATGLFRGWLCHKCNIGLHYVESPDWLGKAQAYLHVEKGS